MGLGEGRYGKPCMGEEVFIDFLTLTGGTVTGNTVTGLAGLTANKYDDQDVLVLTGTLKGYRIRCVTNTTTVLTFEENVQTLGLANTDSVIFGARGKRPTTYNISFKSKVQRYIPAPKYKVDRPRYAGYGQKPADTNILQTINDLEVPFDISDARLLFTIFGDEYVTGTDTGTGGSTLAAATYPGADRVTMTDATGYSNGDIIQVGEGVLAECRKITSIAGAPTLILDFPLRKAHAALAVCNEVTKPFTHNLQFLDRGIYWSLQDCYDELVPAVREAHGIYSKDAEIKWKEHDLVTALIKAFYMTQSTNGTKQTPGDTPSVPFQSSQLSTGISINGIYYNCVKSGAARISRDASENRYSDTLYGTKPASGGTGKIDMFLDLVLDVRNTNLLALLEAGTEFTAIANFIKAAGTDEMKFTFTNCLIEEAPHPITPDGKTVEVSPKMGAEDLAVQVICDIPHFPMGIRV